MRTLYIDTTASDISSPFLFAPSTSEYVKLGQIPLGDALALNLVFCDQNGVCSWSGASGYVIEAALGIANARPSDGTFTLSAGGTAGTPLPANATAAQVQAVLQAIAGIGAGNCLVTGPAGGPWQIFGAGTLLSTDLPAITGDSSDLFPASAVTCVTTREAATGVPQIQMLRVATIPVSYTDTFTAVGTGWQGSLVTATAGLYDMLGDDPDVTVTLAIRVSGPAIGVRTFAQAQLPVVAALIDETALVTAPAGSTYISLSEAVSMFSTPAALAAAIAPLATSAALAAAVAPLATSAALASAIAGVTAGTYALPAATTAALGGVKPDGSTITVTSGGVISSTGATTAALAAAVAPLASSAAVTSAIAAAVAPLASSTAVAAEIATAIAPLATTAALTAAIAGVTAGSVADATATTVGVVKVPVAGNLTIDGAGNIEVPVATASVLGVVKVDGTSITIDGSGKISATGGGGGGGSSTVAINTTIVDGVNGNDSTGAANNLAKPFATLHAAVAASSAGQTIVLMSGSTYTETPASGAALLSVNNLHLVIAEGATLIIKGTSSGCIAASATSWAITGAGTLRLDFYLPGGAPTPFWACTFNGARGQIDVAALQLVLDATSTSGSGNTNMFALVNDADTAQSSLIIRAKDVQIIGNSTVATGWGLYGSAGSLTPTHGIDTVIDFGNVIYVSDPATAGPAFTMIYSYGEGAASSLSYRQKSYYDNLSALASSGGFIRISSANHARIDLDMGVINSAMPHGIWHLYWDSIFSTDSLKIAKLYGNEGIIIGAVGYGPWSIDLGDFHCAYVSGPATYCGLQVTPSAVAGEVTQVNFRSIKAGTSYNTGPAVQISGYNAGSVILRGARIHNPGGGAGGNPVCIYFSGAPGKTIVQVPELICGSAGNALYSSTGATAYIGPGCETNATTAVSGVTTSGNAIAVQSSLF